MKILRRNNLITAMNFELIGPNRNWLKEGQVSINGKDYNIKQSRATKNRKKLETKDHKPTSIVIHFTADGRDGQQAVKYLKQSNVQASAHIVIEKDGTIYQLVPFDTQAWHAGVSAFGDERHFNKHSIGIEIDNEGCLEKIGNKFYTWYDREITDFTKVKSATHINRQEIDYWHIFEPIQIKICEELCTFLFKELQVNNAPSITQILGHDQISPGRKIDPGPLFPIDKLRKNVFEAEALPTRGIVSTKKLNIRQGPGLSNNLIAKPLELGGEVEILDERSGWYFVETTIKGWVSKQHVNTDKS